MPDNWLKVPTSLPRDPRTRAIARQLRNAGVTHERFTENALASLVLGAWIALQAEAEPYIDDDGVLGMGEDEIDKLVGVVGFTKLLPADWLQIVDAERVKLPSFHTDHGLEARQRGLGQRRAARHRTRVTPQRSIAQRSSNAAALRERDDSARPARKRSARGPLSLSGSKSKTQRETGVPLPPDFVLTPALRAIAEERGLNADRVFGKFTANARDKGRLSADWPEAWRHWCLNERLTTDERAALERDRRVAAEWDQARAYARQIECPLEPHEHESPEIYRSRVRTWEVKQPRLDARPDPVGQLKLGRGRLR